MFTRSTVHDPPAIYTLETRAVAMIGFGVKAGTAEMYGALRGRLPAKLVALLKLRVYLSDDTVRRVAGVQMLTPVNSGRLSDQHGLVTVQMRQDARGFTIVDIGTILGLAHLIQEEDRRWLINSRIDLRTFNEVC